jgi:pyruvate carboxylase
VTEEVTGIDIVQAQIKIAEGKTLAEATGKPSQDDVRLNGHALQTRITTEDPQNNFIPGLWPHHSLPRSHRAWAFALMAALPIQAVSLRATTTAFSLKVTAHAQTPEAAIAAMDRALREFRIPRREHQHRLCRKPAQAPDVPQQ